MQISIMSKFWLLKIGVIKILEEIKENLYSMKNGNQFDQGIYFYNDAYVYV